MGKKFFRFKMDYSTSDKYDQNPPSAFKWVKASLVALLISQASLTGYSIAIDYFHRKAEEYIQLQKRFIQGLKRTLATHQPIWCMDEQEEFQQWCENNQWTYRAGTVFHDYFKPIEKECTKTKQTRKYYEEQLDLFFKKVDADATLRTSLEQKIYSSEDEIGVDIYHNSHGEYEIYSYLDPSDPMYSAYLEEMSLDSQLQQSLWDIMNGNKKAIPAFIERAEQLINDVAPFDKLEQSVLSSIEEKCTSREMYEDLESLSDSNTEHHQQMKILDSLIKNYEKAIGEWQEMLQKNRQNEVLHVGLIESQIQQLKKSYRQLEQERHESKERWDKFKEEYIAAFWTDLKAELIRDRVHQIMPQEKFLPPFVLAFGHTHPNFFLQEEEHEEHGPSRKDLKNEDERPDLVFTTLPDRWQIHTVICGESTLAREYPRTSMGLPAPKPF